jgi:hypothetical protein
MALRDPARRKDSPLLDRAGLAAQIAKLEAFRELASGWDSYDAPPPNETALQNGRAVLRFIYEQEEVPSVHLAASAEGGVLLVFSAGGPKYADIECYNDGEILAILSEPSAEPTIWPLTLEEESLSTSLQRIATFLDD